MDLLVVAVAGFFASMVDGALGMGFGPTCASILLATGISPAATSATVNIAKVATGAAAGLSHWRFGNIDRRLVGGLAVPGTLGALVGTTVLTRVDGDDLRPVLAFLLVGVGLRILVRFSRPLPVPQAEGSAADGDRAAPAATNRGVVAAGAAGGVTNGLVGAWGPVVTPYLLHRGVPPRIAVGSVNTAEMAVAVVAAGSLLSSSSTDGLAVGLVVAMLLGGVVAAPLAAYVVRYVPPRALGIAVGALLLLTQVREVVNADVVPANAWALYAVVPPLVAAAALRPRVGRSALPAVAVVAVGHDHVQHQAEAAEAGQHEEHAGHRRHTEQA